MRQVEIARRKGARGVVFFEIGELRSRGHLTRLRDGPFAQKAPERSHSVIASAQG